jgi:hypothetical protein
MALENRQDVFSVTKAPATFHIFLILINHYK